jgi:hypothetical protein
MSLQGPVSRKVRMLVAWRLPWMAVPSLDGRHGLCSRLVACGSWLVARGSWLVAHGSWRMAHGSWLMAHGTWLMVRAVLIKFTLVYEMSPCICESSRRNVWNPHIELCGGLRRMYDQTV